MHDSRPPVQPKLSVTVIVDAIALFIGVLWVVGSLQIEAQLCDPECTGSPRPFTWQFDVFIHGTAIIGALVLLLAAHSLAIGRGRRGGLALLISVSLFGLWLVLLD